MRIRGGSGLGDAIYLRPIVEDLISRGERVTVCSGHPEVFTGTAAEVKPFDRFNIDILAHYTQFKDDPTTNQWQDICRAARLFVPLSFTWNIQSTALVEGIREDAAGRPIIMVHGGRTPMGRTDGFGAELLPDQRGFDIVLAELKDCFTVRVGKGADIYPLDVSVDLNGSTSVSDLLDIGWICDGVVGQCSFAIPIAEAFDKPALFVWAARGMAPGPHRYIRAITPRKVLSKPTSRYVVDDWAEDKIREVAVEFHSVV